MLKHRLTWNSFFILFLSFFSSLYFILFFYRQISFIRRRLYSIISYFFFFYNVLVGLFSCLLRIFKGTVLGVLFLGRIDRTVLMQGFQTWDPGKLNYLLGVFHARTHARKPTIMTLVRLTWFVYEEKTQNNKMR